MGQTNINTGDGSSGMGAGMILGLVLAIVIIGFVVWYFLLNGGGSGTPSPSSIESNLQSVGQSVLQSVGQSVLQSVAPSPS
jgi:hypothetical protein